mmetsp:Transcript_21507/g.59049  ORF Transcript_21507/g.59049 Transcript_21507/m.59049 type:complete len:136 (-) Transcript_21507:79-486(-)
MEDEEDPNFDEVISRTNFTQEDLEKVHRAYRAMERRGYDEVSLKYYFKVVQVNYVSSAIMAKHLDYFAALCGAYADHFDGFGGLELMQLPSIAEKMQYMVEDLKEAVDSSDQEEFKDSLREAIALLEENLESAQS